MSSPLIHILEHTVRCVCGGEDTLVGRNSGCYGERRRKKLDWSDIKRKWQSLNMHSIMLLTKCFIQYFFVKWGNVLKWKVLMSLKACGEGGRPHLHIRSEPSQPAGDSRTVPQPAPHPGLSSGMESCGKEGSVVPRHAPYYHCNTHTHNRTHAQLKCCYTVKEFNRKKLTSLWTIKFIILF